MPAFFGVSNTYIVRTETGIVWSTASFKMLANPLLTYFMILYKNVFTASEAKKYYQAVY